MEHMHTDGGIIMFGYYYRDAVMPQVSPAYTPYGSQMQQVSPAYTPYGGQMQPQASYTMQPQTAGAGNKSAYAMLVAGPDYPDIRGLVTFMDIQGGVMVCADIFGLPPYKPAEGDKAPVGPFGFHIHEKGFCMVGDPAKPFEGCGGHWNPTNEPHGNHAGDFPVLVASNGTARMCFVTGRFSVDDIIGRSVMIHENPDDYRSQPAGNSGKRIACGRIRPWNSWQSYLQ